VATHAVDRLPVQVYWSDFGMYIISFPVRFTAHSDRRLEGRANYTVSIGTELAALS